MKGMTKVFLVQHTVVHDDGTEDTKTIGVYSTKVLAQEAVRRIKKAPGFRNHRSGFSVGPYGLNQDYWADGFGAE
jgi:hypothetical protein